MPKKKPSGRRPKRKRDRYSRVVGWGILASIIIIGLLLWGPLRGLRQPERAKHPAPPRKQEQATKKTEPRPAPAPQQQPQEEKAFVAIVIDDLGQDTKTARELLALHPKITFAVMPGLPRSREAAELATKNRHEVLLHMPMERKNHREKPQAAGTLQADMTPQEFLETIDRNLDSVPGAVGVNNHEGSALTSNKEAMKFFMARLQERNLSFLDSMTDPNSVAYETAREFGIKAARRGVFLDNEDTNPDYIRGQLRELARMAKKRGSAVGIGHPHPTTIAELKKWFAGLDEQGIEIVPVSRLMK